MLVFDDFTIRTATYLPGLRLPRHDHPWTNVTTIVRGEIVEETDRGEHAGRSCSVVVKPAGTLHANRAIGRVPVTTVAIELRHGSELSRIASGCEWSWHDGADAANGAIALQRAMHGADRAAIERSAQSLLARILTSRCDSTPPPWMQEVITRLTRDADSPIRFDTLARSVGLHPVYVSRAFRRHTGKTMSSWLQDVRLGRARHLLSTTTRPLTAVAADCGFTDASHLSRSFRSAHTLTPGAFREICNGAG